MFANEFMRTSNGMKSLEKAGLPQDFDTLFAILNDNFINNYIEKYSELAEIYGGKTKEAHIADLEDLLKFALAGKRFQAVTRLSERLEKLKGWDKQGTGNEIVVDLKLSKSDEGTAIALEQPDTRENKVLNHFKKEGLL